MKKPVLCLFSLILYLLVACSILSPAIEREMMTQVEVKELKSKGNYIILSTKALFSDSEGEHLYDVIDGTGWASGLRASELPNHQWFDNWDGTLSFSGVPRTYRFVLSASRQPVTGEKVESIREFEQRDDQYLFIYPNGVPEPLVLLSHTTIDDSTDTLLLLNDSQARKPFFAKTTQTLPGGDVLPQQVFSLTDVRVFLTALPGLAVVVILLLAGVMLWAAACLESLRKPRWRLILGNGCAMALMLLLCWLILRLTDLPASLMPTSNAFDWAHYRSELGQVFSAMDAFGRTELHALGATIFRRCQLILLAGGALAGLIVPAELILLRRKRR